MREDSNSPDGANLRDTSLENIETDKKTFKEEIKNLSRTDRKMIRGFMRGFGKIIILWLISKNRQHGYEITSEGKQSLERIKNLISKRQDPGETNLYQEFMEDMFSLKKVKN